jgi:outer membrane protein assembly factor BamB
MTKAHPRLVVPVVAGLVLVSALMAGPVGWRTDGTGNYPDAQPPTDWTEDHVLWKTKLPGHSFGSPVVAGKRIFVVSDPAELLCLDSGTGEILWRRSHGLEDFYGADTAKKVMAQFMRLNKEKDRLRHEMGKAKDDKEKKDRLAKEYQAVEKEYQALENKYPVPPALGRRASGNCAATPVFDGNNVYALFGNGIACAYARAGKKLWVKHLEASPLGFGHSSSPVLVDGKLLVHFKDLVALEPRTGEKVWRVRLSAAHATAVPAKVDKTPVVICPAGAVVRISDGKVLLRDGRLGSSECTSLVDHGIIYVCHGTARALRLVPAGSDAVKLEQLWECRLSGGRRTPSSVLHDGLLYAVTTDGILDVVEVKKGKPVYKQRLDIGEDYASATAAGKYLFFGGTGGTAVVVKPGKKYQRVARNKIEGFGSNPVFRGQRMYLRTRQHLYCIGK